MSMNHLPPGEGGDTFNIIGEVAGMNGGVVQQSCRAFQLDRFVVNTWIYETYIIVIKICSLHPSENDKCLQNCLSDQTIARVPQRNEQYLFWLW